MAKKTKQDNPEIEQQTPAEQENATIEQEQAPPVNEAQTPAEPICCVVSTNGRGLNLREVPEGKVRKILPDGCTVYAEDLMPGQEWVWVNVGDLHGWVKGEFLRPLEDGEV